MEIKDDDEFFADDIVITKKACITIAPGATLTLVARNSVLFEPGVVVQSIGREGAIGADGVGGHCTTDVGRDGGHGGNGHAGAMGQTSGNLIVCATVLRFEENMEQFFQVSLLGGKGGRGGKGGDGGYAGRASAACFGGCNAGRGGNGGSGGVGGDGGKGGTLWLNLVESPENRKAVEQMPPPNLSGGQGGDPGRGGDGGKGGDHHCTACGCRNAGPNGSAGSRGNPGKEGPSGEFRSTFSASFAEVMKKLQEQR
jgi:hypothetical protein